MSATLPISNNSLSSDASGAISGGGGFADSYYQPFILGWDRDRASVRAVYGFLAPTGSFTPGATTNVGSGYWTHVVASGQTFYLTPSRKTSVSAFQMYEFHTEQQGTGINPGQNLDLDYSVMQTVSQRSDFSVQVGLVGYGQWQTTADRPRRVSGPGRSSLRGELSWLRVKRRLAAAASQPRLQILQRVLEPLDIPGLLRADFRIGRFLMKRGSGRLRT
jgi:hypothetical protein